MNARAVLSSFLAIVVFAACHSLGGASGPNDASLRVTSFNIRYGTANDGDNRWENRREAVIETVRALDADLLGLQEALAFQVDELREAFPRYAVIGIGRDAGGAGEQTTLLLDKERFRVVRSGMFWLSETPEVVASRSWDAALPRICTWAVLFDAKAQQEFVWMNSHFDHRGAEARERSGALMHSRMADFRPLPAIITGDFNAGEDSAPLAALRRGDLVDPFRVLYPDATGVGTFNGFEGKRAGAKIDYVLCSPQWEIRDATIDRHEFDGRYPSDHFPVSATLGWHRQ